MVLRRVHEHQIRHTGSAISTTKYAVDPLDRTTGKTTDAGTAKAKTRAFNYLGLPSEVLDEEVAGTPGRPAIAIHRSRAGVAGRPSGAAPAGRKPVCSGADRRSRSSRRDVGPRHLESGRTQPISLTLAQRWSRTVD
jgi:hypothetical protein